MRAVHLPRHFAILFLILLAAAFLSGNVLAFSAVHAAASAAPTPTVTGTPGAPASATPLPAPAPASADTTGILVLGIILVLIILIGLVWGTRIRRNR